MYKYFISHNISQDGDIFWLLDVTREKHLSMAADQELPDNQLPAGHTPVWIEPPPGATQVQMLERVEDARGFK